MSETPHVSTVNGHSSISIQSREEAEEISQFDDPLLAVRDLYTQFRTEGGTVRAVDGVSFEVQAGEILGIVGESGCGKSVTSLSLMNLIRPPGVIPRGRVLFNGEDLLEKSKEEIRQIRGNEISMIFQDPTSALNPVFDIGWQVGEPLRVHKQMSMKASRKRAIELMRRVGIPSPEDRVDSFPHQFSGGMRQRAMIATALACEPQLLIADEPTTSLDVTIEAQILDLIQELNRNENMAVLLITHDLGVIAEVCDRLAVMYAGRIVEYGDVNDIFNDPRHPYTKGLMECVPDPRKEIGSTTPIEGEVPELDNLPEGCNFAPRCPFKVDDCEALDPRLQEVTQNRYSACIWDDPS